MKNSSLNLQNFNAHGKLLISGEYLVLRGANALAIPLKFGQSLQVSSTVGEPKLIWKAYYPGKKWFEATYNTSNFDIKETDNPELASRLRDILLETHRLNPEFLINPEKTTATSLLNFSPEWGIGSSSSLIANIGQWAKVDPFKLNHLIYGGSGYDIAAALSDKPVIYHLFHGKPVYRCIDFKPPYTRNLYFVYLNRKQNSKIAVQNFANISLSKEIIEAISEITLKMVSTDIFEEFASLMEKHEQILAELLQKVPVKHLLFPDFKGTIKSMGAWGGDFVLVASKRAREHVTDYFKNKGYETVFGWDEMVFR